MTLGLGSTQTYIRPQEVSHDNELSDLSPSISSSKHSQSHPRRANVTKRLLLTIKLELQKPNHRQTMVNTSQQQSERNE